jgi:hypothetical protein
MQATSYISAHHYVSLVATLAALPKLGSIPRYFTDVGGSVVLLLHFEMNLLLCWVT